MARRSSKKAPDIRTNVVFSKHVHERVKKVAKFKGVSFAQFIRDAVTNELADPVPPIYKSRKAPRDMAKNHDKYLYGDKA